VHLRLPAIEPGVKAFVWALLLSFYLWGFLILAVGTDKGTSTVLALIAFGAIFLFVRVYGESEEP
jgi:lipopolysaccharide export LptBFGC system permease protein LptF